VVHRFNVKNHFSGGDHDKGTHGDRAKAKYKVKDDVGHGVLPGFE
jgi:hypothetical protein